MEHVLDGEAEEGNAEELREHLSHCPPCAQAWQTARQVRTLLHDCEPPDPGEAYFEAATERIMARIGEPALQGRSVEESRTLGSMRYGPLAIRGVGPGFVVAVGLLAAALFGPSPAPVLAGPNPLVGNPRLTPVPALAGADVGVAAARGDVGRYDVIAAGDRLHRALAHRRMEMTVAKRVVVPNEVHLSPPETPPSQK